MITGIEIMQAALREQTKVPVVSKVPRPRPEVFIRVDQAAPRALSPVQDRVRIIVQVYGSDLEQVLNLCGLVRHTLSNLEGLAPSCFGTDDIEGPVEFPDPDIPNVYRWQITGVIYIASTY